MILLFTLKLYQFIRGEERDEYIKTIDVIYKDNNAQMQENPLCKNDNFKSEHYEELIDPLIEFLAKITKESPIVKINGLNAGSLAWLKFYSTYVKDHQIYLFERTIISDCININVRSFIKCSKCNFSEILVINIGNISIPIYEFLNSFHQVKSFNSLLEYYYKTN
jgi:hypothetical protein